MHFFVSFNINLRRWFAGGSCDGLTPKRWLKLSHTSHLRDILVYFSWSRSTKFTPPAAVRSPHSSALANVQELGIDHKNIPKLMPKIQRYFGHPGRF